MLTVYFAMSGSPYPFDAYMSVPSVVKDPPLVTLPLEFQVGEVMVLHVPSPGLGVLVTVNL